MAARIQLRIRGLATTATTERPNPFNTMPPHLCYILLESPDPISTFPSRHSTALQRALQLKVTRWGGIVNWAHYPDSVPMSDRRGVAARAFFTSGRSLEIPELNEDNLETIHAQLTSLRDTDSPLVNSTPHDVFIYVCTHGARDCRCGTTGSETLQALREEISSRSNLATRIRTAEVAHVGGHQYAANLLIYPHGEWLGYMKPEDAPTIIDRILDTPSSSLPTQFPPLFPHNWRGRIGMPKETQAELLSNAVALFKRD